MDTIRNTVGASAAKSYDEESDDELPTMTLSVFARVATLTLVITMTTLSAHAQERCFRDQNGQLKCCDQSGNCYYPQ